MKQKNFYAYLLVFTLLTIPVATASYNNIHSSWQTYDGTITVDGKTFDITLGDGDDVLRVKKGLLSTVVALDSCSRINEYQICFENVSEDRNRDIDDQGQLRPGIRVSIDKETGVVPSLNTHKTYEEPFLLNSNHEIQVFFENMENISLNQIEYRLRFENVRVENTTMNQVDEEIRYSFDLQNQHDNQTHTINMVPLRAENITLTEHVRFTETGSWYETRNTYNIPVIDYFDFDISYEQGIVSYTLQNNQEENITIHLESYDEDNFNINHTTQTVQTNTQQEIHVEQVNPGSFNHEIIFKIMVGEEEFFEQNTFLMERAQPTLNQTNTATRNQTEELPETSNQSEETQNNIEDVDQAQDEEEAQEGFLVRIVSWFTNLF